MQQLCQQLQLVVQPWPHDLPYAAYGHVSTFKWQVRCRLISQRCYQTREMSQEIRSKAIGGWMPRAKSRSSASNVFDLALLLSMLLAPATLAYARWSRHGTTRQSSEHHGECSSCLDFGAVLE